MVSGCEGGLFFMIASELGTNSKLTIKPNGGVEDEAWWWRTNHWNFADSHVRTYLTTCENSSHFPHMYVFGHCPPCGRWQKVCLANHFFCYLQPTVPGRQSCVCQRLQRGHKRICPELLCLDLAVSMSSAQCTPKFDIFISSRIGVHKPKPP